MNFSELPVFVDLHQQFRHTVSICDVSSVSVTSDPVTFRASPNLHTSEIKGNG